MVSTEKPKSITITIADRKDGKYRSFVVYGANIDVIENKIKKLLKD